MTILDWCIKYTQTGFLSLPAGRGAATISVLVFTNTNNVAYLSMFHT